MKKLTYFASLLTVLAGAASCQKNIEQPQSQPQPQPSGEYRQVTIEAGSAGSKTSVNGGILTWSEDDKLNIVPQSGTVAAVALDIKSGVGEAAGIFEGMVDASITDATDLYGWCGGNWTYDAGAFSVEMPAEQTYVANGLAENAYPSIGTGSIKDGISLSNPMGVLKLIVKGASSDLVKSVSVTSATKNLAGEFTVTPGATPSVSGGSSKTVTLNVADPYVALSATGVNFYIVFPPAEYAAGDLSVTVTFSDDSYLNTTFADAVTVTAGNATAQEVSDYTGRCGTLKGQEWVMIKAKYDGTNDSFLKWGTQNLAITTSGQTKWNGTNYVIGDYFQWAASYGGYNITADVDKVPANLLIYTSFTTKYTGGSANQFTFKSDKTSGFAIGYAPYYKSGYTKYTSTDSKTTLEQSDDVANIILGGSWRIPTGGSAGEIKAMRDVTYWAFDNTDKGYYVFKPGVGTSGTAGTNGDITGTDDKTKALLFFPLAGCGYDNTSSPIFGYVGETGFYWSRTINNNDSTPSNWYVTSYNLCINKDDSYPAGTTKRYRGFSVRPVSN